MGMAGLIFEEKNGIHQYYKYQAGEQRFFGFYFYERKNSNGQYDSCKRSRGRNGHYQGTSRTIRQKHF